MSDEFKSSRNLFCFNNKKWAQHVSSSGKSCSSWAHFNIKHVFVLKVTLRYRWSAAALLSIVPKTFLRSQPALHYLQQGMINKLPQSPSMRQASGLLKATSSPRDNGAISCWVRRRGTERAKQASIVKQGHHIGLSCPRSNRQIQASSEIHGLGGHGGKGRSHGQQTPVQAFLFNTLTGYTENCLTL